MVLSMLDYTQGYKILKEIKPVTELMPFILALKCIKLGVGSSVVILRIISC